MFLFLYTHARIADLSQLGLRMRLYGCERLRRERLIGECVMSFASFHAVDGPCMQWLTLEPRCHLSVSYDRLLSVGFINYTIPVGQR